MPCMKLDETAKGLILTQPHPPDLIIERAGGLEAFPAYNVFQQLAVTRLGDEQYGHRAQ